MRKYNPCHNSMINNFRNIATAQGVEHKHLSNEQIFALIEESTGFSIQEEEQEEFIRLLKENLP